MIAAALYKDFYLILVFFTTCFISNLVVKNPKRKFTFDINYFCFEYEVAFVDIAQDSLGWFVSHPQTPGPRRKTSPTL